MKINFEKSLIPTCLDCDKVLKNADGLWMRIKSGKRIGFVCSDCHKNFCKES